MVATNTIAQGDSRKSGLAFIKRTHGAITYAERYVKWKGEAVVEVNLIGIRKLEEHHFPLTIPACLDGAEVPTISSWLDDGPEVDPSPLARNNKGFLGALVRGIGFVLNEQETRELILQDPKNADCLLPFLVGDDINRDPEQKTHRYVIYFRDWPREKAMEYPLLFSIVEQRVKPQRMKLKPISSDYRKLRDKWWQFARLGIDMQGAILNLSQVMVRATISNTHAIVFVPKNMVYSHKCIVFAFDDYYHFALLQSNVHEAWVRRFTSTMRTDTNYSPSDCFDNFPFPESPPAGVINLAEKIGKQYHTHRQELLVSIQRGLTYAYGLFHSPSCDQEGVGYLRNLHIEMDKAILRAYGWEDIALTHEFRTNDRGQLRFSISPTAQRELLARLIELNQQAAAQEAAQGLLASQAGEAEEGNDDGL
jgi:hypothetical protein